MKICYLFDLNILTNQQKRSRYTIYDKQIEIETLEKELAELKNRLAQEKRSLLAQEKRSLKDTEEIIESAQSQLVAAKIYCEPKVRQEIETNFQKQLKEKQTLEENIKELEAKIKDHEKAIRLSLQPDSLFDRLLSGLNDLWSLFVEACRGIWAFFTGNAKATSEEEVSLTNDEPSEVEEEHAGDLDHKSFPVPQFSQYNCGEIPLEEESHFAGQAVLPKKKTVRFNLGD